MNVGTAELAGRTEGKGRSVTGIGGWGWRRGGHAEYCSRIRPV